MPGNADPSRIYDDPALADRRGDPTGPIALVFLGILVAAFAVVGLVLLSVPLGPDPTARPAGTPGILATARPSPTPTPTGVSTAAPVPSVDPTGAPGATPGEATDPPLVTPEPETTLGPRRTRQPRPSPTQRSGRGPTRGGIGETIPVFVDGERVGGVVVESFQAGELAGGDLPAGARIMVLQVRYVTAFGMDYDAADWVAEDADGERLESLGNRAPAPALGSGRLAPDESVTGNVAFIRERRVLIEELMLTDGEGRDLVIVRRDGAP